MMRSLLGKVASANNYLYHTRFNHQVSLAKKFCGFVSNLWGVSRFCGVFKVSLHFTAARHAQSKQESNGAHSQRMECYQGS